MFSRSNTTIEVKSTSLGHPSVTACTRAGSASWTSLITAKHWGTNAENIPGDARRSAPASGRAPPRQEQWRGFRKTPARVSCVRFEEKPNS